MEMYQAHYNFDVENTAVSTRLREVSARSHFSDSQLRINTLADAVLVPPGAIAVGGGIYHEGEYVQDSLLHRGWFGKMSLRTPDDWDEAPERVLYLGMFYACWGHCLTDGLKHLWPFVTGEVRTLLSQGVKLVYLTTGLDEKLPENFISCLRAVGVPVDKIIRVKRPTRFKEVLLPDPSFFLTESDGRLFTQEYVDTIDAIVKSVGCDKVDLIPSRRVYFTRAAWHAEKADCGEASVAKAFKRAGYEIVSPEQLTLRDQVRTMRECEEFATTEGSCAHNAVFMRPGYRLLIIRKAAYVNGYQLPVNDMRSLQVTYVDANWSRLSARPAEPWRGPFFLYVNRRLAAYLGCRPHFPFSSFCRYLLVYLRMRTRRLASVVKWNVIGFFRGR